MKTEDQYIDLLNSWGKSYSKDKFIIKGEFKDEFYPDRYGMALFVYDNEAFVAWFNQYNEIHQETEHFKKPVSNLTLTDREGKSHTLKDAFIAKQIKDAYNASNKLSRKRKLKVLSTVLEKMFYARFDL